MRFDAKVEVVCDKCEMSIEIEPSYVFRSYNAESGYYDTSDDAITKKLEQEGWTHDEELEKDYCENCSEPEDDDEDEDEAERQGEGR